MIVIFFFQAEDGIRDLVRSRGLGDVYKRQFIINAKLFKAIGGFDKDYFAHQEEIDLCWRMKRAGYQILYEPRSEVYHLGGGSLNYESPKKTYLNFRNNLTTIFKNCLLYTSPSPRDRTRSRMPSSA